jgi:hypothetical protein
MFTWLRPTTGSLSPTGRTHPPHGPRKAASTSTGRVTVGDEGGRFVVGFADKVRDKVQVLRGRVKRNTGEAIGNPRLQAEGSADKVMDNLK